MKQGHQILDFHDPNMKDWKEQLLLRDKAILDLFQLAEGYHLMIDATSGPKEPYRDNETLRAYRSFVEEMKEKNASK
jgi:hypothetical protein